MSIVNSTLRILDANFNRASEGLRVVEEFARFVLNDPVWPESGAGLILGSVIKINRLDEAPLRQSLTIEPRRRVRDVSRVVVLGTGTGDASTLCSLCQGTGEAGASTQ